MSKGSTVFYMTNNGVYRARVKTMHRDGSVSIVALFEVDKAGKDGKGYLGFTYRVWADQLRDAA